MKELKKVIVLVLASFLMLATTTLALSWNPDCITPISAPWKTMWNQLDTISLCYTDETTLFIKPKNYYKGSNVDVFLDNISFENDKQLGFKQGVLVQFDYYIPFYQPEINGTKTCLNPDYTSAQMVFISNDETEDFSAEAFNTNEHVFIPQELDCGYWHSFNMSVLDFVNDYGTTGNSFSHNSRFIGAIAFELSNMYIKNIRFVKTNGSVFEVW